MIEGFFLTPILPISQVQDLVSKYLQPLYDLEPNNQHCVQRCRMTSLAFSQPVLELPVPLPRAIFPRADAMMMFFFFRRRLRKKEATRTPWCWYVSTHSLCAALFSLWRTTPKARRMYVCVVVYKRNVKRISPAAAGARIHFFSVSPKRVLLL